MKILIELASAGIIMGAIDFLWLGFIAKKLYYGELGPLLLKKPNMAAALLFYAIYVVGTVVFVISPAFDAGSWLYAAGMGALFGLVCYATYDLTNLSTLKGFSIKVTVIDLLWGAMLTAVVSSGAFFVTQWLVG